MRAESDLILGIDKAKDGEDGEVSERHYGCKWLIKCGRIKLWVGRAALYDQIFKIRG